MIFKGHLDIVWVKKVPPEKNTLPLEKKIIFSSKNEKKKKKKKIVTYYKSCIRNARARCP